MLSFRNRPIRQKLVIITMVTTAAALLLTGLGIIMADSVLFRGYLNRDLSALARIVADNSTAALAFNDPASAQQTLAALHARPHVELACIYRLNGTLLAQYAQAAGFACPQHESQDTSSGRTNDLRMVQPILLRGKRIGNLILLYDLGEVQERARLYGGIVLGFLLAASLVAFLLSSHLRSAVTRPIARLVSATTSVSRTGDYSIRAEKLSGDELGLLVDGFNDMLAGIQVRDEQLKRALADREAALREAETERERFVFLAEAMPQKIFTTQPDGEVDYLNRQWLDFTGLTFEQIKDWSWTQLVHPDDLEGNVRAWRDALASGEPFRFEQRFRRADGQYRWHLSRAHPMRDSEGKITMWIGTNTDIHEQKEREQELRRANEDLQQFAYSASHDLQEPIRNVTVYSEVIAKRYGPLFDEQGLHFLTFLTDGGKRLARLVNDLLAYTQVSLAEITDSQAKASVALENALAALAEAIRETGARVTFDSLPEVGMGEAHLQQLFQNLVSNALKYRGQEPPRVHVSVADQGSFCCFSVQDNGIGIDPQYKEKIFGVFKRLHHAGQYSGTGIGLAICQRVVERYGGRIWVESQLGRGATFYFTVPRQAGWNFTAKAESTAS